MTFMKKSKNQGGGPVVAVLRVLPNWCKSLKSACAQMLHPPVREMSDLGHREENVEIRKSALPGGMPLSATCSGGMVGGRPAVRTRNYADDLSLTGRTQAKLNAVGRELEKFFFLISFFKMLSHQILFRHKVPASQPPTTKS